MNYTYIENKYLSNPQYSTTTYKNSIAYSTVIHIKGNTVFCMVPVNYGMYGHGTQNRTTEGSTTKRVRAEFELKGSNCDVVATPSVSTATTTAARWIAMRRHAYEAARSTNEYVIVSF